MNNSQIKGMAYEERLDLSATAKIICKNQNVTSHHLKPSKRYGHLSFIYKGKLYVQGGCTNQGKLQTNSAQENKASIYCINLDKERTFSADQKKIKKGPEISDYKWQKLTCKFSPVANNQFQNLSYAAYCIFPNKKRLYTFGGTNAQERTSNCLFRLDLDDLEWSKPEQKGAVPKARQDASLYHYVKNDKNYLVLYGGANFETYQIFSDIHFYQIQTKFWFQCHNLASNFIQPRLSPAVAFNQNKIYLFGGYYIDAQMKRGYLNDLYQIQFNLTVQKGKPYGRSFSKRLDEINYFQGNQQPFKPQKRCSASLIFFKSDFFQVALSTNKKQNNHLSNCLALIGGEKLIEDKRKIITNSDFWLFSLGEMKWKCIPLVNQFRPRSSFSAVFDKQLNKFFIFGGLSSMQTVLNDLVSLKLNCKTIENIPIKTKSVLIQQKIRPAINLQGLMIQELSNNINFPFSAIGMITENFVNFQATFCDISYHISKNHPVAQNYIKFQSNAKFLMLRQAMISHFLYLKGGVRSYVQGTDKKIKAQMNKQNLAKQIGSNFILGGLRLGNQILFANLNQDTYNIQIFVIMKCGDVTYGQIKGQQQQQDSFKSFKLFQFLIEKDQILTQDVFSTHRLNSEYKQRRFFLQQVLSQESRERLKILIVQAINTIKKGQVKNLFYISKLKTVQGQECTIQTKQTQLQLFPDMLNNDIIYGDRQLIKELQMNKVPVYESLDVSLKTYMSYLYLQCQTQFTVSIHGLQRKQIYVQEYLMKIDQLLKSKDVVEISNDFQCDCKIRQLYYFSNKGFNSSNNKLDRNDVKLFVNGILYYQKSRLIRRHQVPLGQFIYHYKIKEITQYEEFKKKKNPKVHNNYFTQVFGHIELPESVPANSTKTDFLFDVMLEKTQAKLMIFDEKIKLQKQGKIMQKKQKR